MSQCISLLSRTLFALIACHGLCGSAAAQDFSVYTRVLDMKAADVSARPGQKPQKPIVARSSLFFHANKAYDYIEADGEVLIYEPNAEKFTILHLSRNMATTLSFEDLERMVRDAEIKAGTKILRAKEQHLESASRIGMIEFQLEPRFKELFDRERDELKLTSSFMNYQVKCKPVDTPERLQAYLKYCDWMARLNFVLHPQAPLPGPRLTLNERLRKHKLMPEHVTLQAEIGDGIQLRAEHRIEWPLDPHDRERIHQWQTLLESNETRKIPFSQFQDVLLAERK